MSTLSKEVENSPAELLNLRSTMKNADHPCKMTGRATFKKLSKKFSGKWIKTTVTRSTSKNSYGNTLSRLSPCRTRSKSSKRRSGTASYELIKSETSLRNLSPKKGKPATSTRSKKAGPSWWEVFYLSTSSTLKICNRLPTLTAW